MICFNTYIFLILFTILVGLITYLIYFKKEKIEVVEKNRYIKFERKIEEIGYVYNDKDIYKLFEEKIDKRYFYHVLYSKDNNVIKIDLEERFNQIQNGDSILLPEIGNQIFKVKLYENKFIYNPFVF